MENTSAIAAEHIKADKPFLVDVPVKINIWIRPECQRAQFEVLRQARPSIMFLISDGGRNDKEWEAIRVNRKIFDEEIDWECTVYRMYEDHNNGLYTMGRKSRSLIWDNVDRCIFLEDDYVPAVSYFRFCAELLEKYKDDERIEMICGHNPMVTYEDAAPNDYFFSENGWSIWGTASWKRVEMQREYPFDYADNQYIKRCIESNMNEFWYKKVKGYCDGKLVDNHVPGGEYYHAVNSVLYHRLSIMPTRNMIKNIGYDGAHTSANLAKKKKYFGAQTYEIEFPIKHPKYVIDDKYFGREYDKLIGHAKKNPVLKFFGRAGHFIKLIFTGKAVGAIKRRLCRSHREL